MKNTVPPKTRVAIGLPRGSDTGYKYEFIESIFMMFGFSPCAYKMISVNKVHHQARNDIIEEFLATDMEYLLFIDSDMIWEPDSLAYAYETMQRDDVDIVTGIYFTKANPHLPVLKKLSMTAGCFSIFTEWGNEPFEVDGSGMGFMLIPRYVLEETKADIVTIGEAEETIIELLKCKREKGDLSQIKGIAYRNNEDVVVNERRELIWKLDSIPFPEWSLFPMEKYTTSLHLYRMSKDDKALGILANRGCVNRCNFCYRMEKGIRLRSIENIIEEIKLLKEKYGVTYFQTLDELFVFSKKRIFEFYEALKENNLKIKFDCNARVNIFDEEIAVCLKKSGCTFLNFGMESSDQNVLNLMKKNTTVDQNIKAAEIARKIGIGLGLNFIWGNKGDSEKSLRDNVDLIKKYNTYDQIRTIRPVTPFPGSELYYEAIERGLLSGPEDFFNKFRNSDLLTVNFTDIPEEEFYKLLFEANKDLIIDHFTHTTRDMNSANRLIKAFYDLYFRNKVNFRGARRNNKED